MVKTLVLAASKLQRGVVEEVTRWKLNPITFWLAEHWDWFNRVFLIIEPDELVTKITPYQWQ